MGTINSEQNGFLLLFQIGKRNFGIPLEQVLEVILPPILIRIPGNPAMAEGIFNYRGEAFMAVRFKSLMEAGKEIGPRSSSAPQKNFEVEEKMVLLSPVSVLGGTMRIALRVDRVRGVFRWDNGRLEIVSEDILRNPTQGSIYKKRVNLKDDRGNAIIVDFLDLSAVRKKVLEGFKAGSENHGIGSE